MEKKKVLLVILGIMLLSIGFYWFFIYPNSYNQDRALKNGDIVMGADGNYNSEKLYSFIENIDIKESDNIRITSYSKEGYAMIIDLDFNGHVIKCTIDNTRNLYGRKYHKEYKTYTKIIKKGNDDYFLIDETKENEAQWIYQEK